MQTQAGLAGELIALLHALKWIRGPQKDGDKERDRRNGGKLNGKERRGKGVWRDESCLLQNPRIRKRTFHSKLDTDPSTGSTASDLGLSSPVSRKA